MKKTPEELIKKIEKMVSVFEGGFPNGMGEGDYICAQIYQLLKQNKEKKESKQK